MDRHEVEAELMDFVQRQFHASADNLVLETHLFREGIVDSIGVLELVRFLETRFGLKIDPEEMILKNFESVAAMRDFVQRSAEPRE